jgi:hypothetical protein
MTDTGGWQQSVANFLKTFYPLSQKSTGNFRLFILMLSGFSEK